MACHNTALGVLEVSTMCSYIVTGCRGCRLLVYKLLGDEQHQHPKGAFKGNSHRRSASKRTACPSAAL